VSTPPSGKQLLHVHQEHGIARGDPYHWLKDRNDPDTIPHLEAENAHTDAALGPASFRKALYDEMLARVQETDQSVPWEKNGWRYLTRTEEGRAYPIYARMRLPDGAEEIVLDHNALAEGRAFYQIGGMSISRDQRRVAWLEDTSGAERYVLRVRDIATGQDLPVYASDLKWTLAWAADGETIFVTAADAASRPARALRVRIGERESTVVHEEPDELFFVSLSLTHDERYVLIGSQSKTTSEWRIVDARQPTALPEIVEPRRAGIEYDVEHHEGRWLIRTNDHAKNFQVRARMPGGTIAVIVPPREDVLVEGVLPFRRFLVFQERVAGLPRLRIADLERGGDHVVDVPEPAYEIDFERNPEFDTTTLRFVYASFVTPRSVFAYDMVTRERRLLKEDPVRGGYDRTLYTSERLTATAKDGAAIPISIVRRKDTALPAPLLLYGYGAYGMSMPVWFSSSRLTLLDRGVVFAIAHVRGGSELGRLWYDKGKLEHKQNTFDDFIEAAEHLVAVGMTTREQLAIEGASAGGLLVGAVLNKRPDLFRAAIAGVPFVDALNTMLDAQLPLTITEYEEWGNPTDRTAYETIRSYAPYENVRPQRYPAILATAGLNDPRVGYWEAAKWILRLREHATAGSGPILLHVNLDAGHAGASGRYQALEEQALRYAFLLQQWGLDTSG
jgi:oligopeptidase B